MKEERQKPPNTSVERKRLIAKEKRQVGNPNREGGEMETPNASVERKRLIAKEERQVGNPNREGGETSRKS